MVLLPMTLSDSYYPNHAIFTFCVAFPIFVTGGDRNVKFVHCADHSKSQHMDDKTPLKGCGHCDVTLNLWALGLIKSLERLKLRVVKFCARVG